LPGWNTVVGTPYGEDTPTVLTVCWVHFSDARWVGWRPVLDRDESG
jgi:hypothetical protein